MGPHVLDIPVAGGRLRALRWGAGENVIVAAHGITSSAMAWQAVGRNLPDGWSLVAPDLRGRGGSSHLPGPYGLGRHAEDVLATIRYLGGHRSWPDIRWAATSPSSPTTPHRAWPPAWSFSTAVFRCRTRRG